MKKILLAIILILSSHSAFAAATWYVRPTTGDDTVCSGAFDAPKGSLTGTGQACAKKTIFAITPHRSSSGTAVGATLLQGGDTVILGEPTGTPGSNEVGFDTTNNPLGSTSCAAGGCQIDILPSGPDASHPTRILGRQYNTGCSQKFQFWGTTGVNSVFYQSGNSNIDIECIEITDHSACMFRTGMTGTTDGFPNLCVENSGPFARDGVRFSNMTNLTLKYVDIHGVSEYGMMLLGALGTFTFDHLNVYDNGWANVNSDPGDGSNPTSSATVNLTNSHINFAGCGERYPLINSNVGDPANVHHCWAQTQGGAFTDGVGMDGTNFTGTWNIINSDISHNGQDGWDCLHCGSGHVNISRSRFEGNGGNQVKFNNLTANIENSVVLGNCYYFHGQSFTSTQNGAFEDCRAGGEAIVVGNGTGGQVTHIYNNTVIGNGTGLVLLGANGAPNCNGSTVWQLRNNIFLGGQYYNDTTRNAYFTFNNGTGTCASQAISEDYNQIYNTKNGAADVSGSHSRYSNPQLSGQSSLNLQAAPYYQALLGYSLVAQSATSPSRFSVTGINSADETLTFTSNGTADYYGTVRPASWDAGAIQYGACSLDGGFCNGATDCCTASCNSSRCGVVTCSSDGTSCAVNGDCCNGTCTAGICGTGTCSANGVACSVNGTCCSGICTSGACAATSCTSDQAACTSNGNCCNGLCTSSLCGLGNGTACSTSSQCINNNCNSGTCCNLNTASCSSNTDCCSGSCSGGTCIAACTANTSACSVDSDCCSGNCCSGTCTASACPAGSLANSCRLKSSIRITGSLKVK